MPGPVPQLMTPTTLPGGQQVAPPPRMYAAQNPQPLPMGGAQLPVSTQFYQFNPATLQQIQAGNPNAVSPAAIVARNAYTPVNGLNNAAGQVFNQNNARWNQYDLATAAQNQTATGMDANTRLAQMMGNQKIQQDLPGKNRNALGQLLMGAITSAPLVGGLISSITPKSGATATATGGNSVANSTGGQGGSVNGAGTGFGGQPGINMPAQQYSNPNAFLQGNPSPATTGYNIGGNIGFGGPVAGYGGGGGIPMPQGGDPYTADVNQSPGLTGAINGTPVYSPYNGGVYMPPQTAAPSAAGWGLNDPSLAWQPTNTGYWSEFPFRWTYDDVASNQGSGGVMNPPNPAPAQVLTPGQQLLYKYPNFLSDGRLIDSASVGGAYEY